MKKLLVLLLVLAVASAANAVVFEDNFDHMMSDDWLIHDYDRAAEGDAECTLGGWDGFLGSANVVTAHNYVDTTGLMNGAGGDASAWMPHNTDGAANGVLRLTEYGNAWAGTDNNGAFLYKNYDGGNFVATVEIKNHDSWWSNLGGLMVRKANPGVEEGDEVGDGANENWVYLSYFPVWGVGNGARNCVNGSSPEVGLNFSDPQSFLKMSRVGSTIYMETSADGVTYTSLSGLEAGIERTDLDGEVQIGIFGSSYDRYTATMEFDNFVLDVPEPATILMLGLGGIALIRRKR